MKCHDPRLSDDRDEKGETDNPALIVAEVKRKFNPDVDVCWLSVAIEADYCDEPVAGLPTS